MPLPTHCPLCNTGAEKQSILTKHVYGDSNHKHAFFKCEFCNVIYLYPQLTSAQEHQFYAKEFERFMSTRSGENSSWENPEKHVKSNEAQFQRRWKYLKNILPKHGKILEFGCSSGFMLYPLMEQGYECYGIEPSKCFSEYLKIRGVHIFENISTINLQFDVLMHFFLLEHVRNPIDFIQSNLKLLKTNGELIIEIPNASDPLHTIYAIPEFERFYWSIAHHWYFTEDSICFLLNQIPHITYKILKDQRYDLSNHIVWARDGKPGGMGRFSHYFNEKLNQTYKENLISSGHCDTLVIYIKKKS